MCLFMSSVMKSNYVLLSITLLIGIFLINGCTSQTTQSNPTSDCHAFDGTWKGVISDSGSIETKRTYDITEESTHNPFIAQYDFEMAIESDEKGMYAGEDHICAFTITHVKVSHPLFGCQQGCAPVQVGGENTYSSWMSTNKDGYGVLHIGFDNGASISMFSEDDRLRVTPEGNKMELYIPEGVENWETIGSIGGAEKEYRTAETYNCELVGNKVCSVEYINKNTIILNKIS